jgi:hypothetical protein
VARIGALVTISLLLVGVGSAPDSYSLGDDVRAMYRRAHASAVRFRRQRDDLQRRLAQRVRQVHRLERRLASHVLTPVTAIRLVFGPYAGEAIRVADCETGGSFSTRASNGQYLGLFQMSSYARDRYGHSETALGQAQAAYRYFVASGQDWSPWECQP